MKKGQISISTAHGLVKNLPDKALPKVKAEKKQNELKETINNLEKMALISKKLKRGNSNGLKR